MMDKSAKLERFWEQCWAPMLLLGLVAVVSTPGAGLAQTTPENHDKVLLVGTKHAPPFSIKQSDGSWSGISIDLWQELSKDLGIKYELRETDLQGLLEGVSKADIDVAVAALTITAEREKELDFSHGFYSSGLAIAVPVKAEERVFTAIMGFFSLAFIKAVGTLLVILFLVGMLVWFFERRENEHFGGSASHGIASGLWWSAVTMTTVGYGDKVPVTHGGRAVALVWMFTSIIIISSFTAAFATALTIEHFDVGVEGPQDLNRVRCATVENSTSQQYLEKKHINYKSFSTLRDAVGAIATGQIEAVVYDEPMLRYLVKTDFSDDVRVLRTTFEHQVYGFAVASGSPLREPLNRALLAKLKTPTWKDILYRYLGQ